MLARTVLLALLLGAMGACANEHVDPSCGAKSGCVTGLSSGTLVSKQEIEATAPTCRTVAECEVAWAAARQWVVDNAGYKLDTYSADSMQTFAPLGSERALAARVSKEPVGNGSYRIIASFSCGSNHGCSLRPDVALRRFDQFVAAKIGITSP